MRFDARATLGFALLACGSASLSVALLDYLAYEFAFVDLTADVRSQRSYWWPGPTGTLPGRSLIVLTLVAGAAAFGAFALARVRRTAGKLLTLAAVCAALQLVIAVVTAWLRRGQLLADVVAVDPETSIRWLKRAGLYDYSDALGVQNVAGALASMSLLATAIAGLRVALRRGWPLARVCLVAALAVPPLLATGVLAHLWDVFVRSGWLHPDWTQLVRSTRWALVAAALLATAAASLLPGRPRPRPLAAAGLCALGLAAVVATAPHRRTIDALYPLPRLIPSSAWHVRVQQPWDFVARAADSCVAGPDYTTSVLVRVDRSGDVVATINGIEVPLVGEAADVRAAIARHLHLEGFVVLFAGPRVPVAALTPLFDLLPPTESGRVVVAGITAAELPSAAGPVTTWRGCALGVLQLPTFLRTRFAPGTTWGEIVDDPALVAAPEAP